MIKRIAGVSYIVIFIAAPSGAGRHGPGNGHHHGLWLTLIGVNAERWRQQAGNLQETSSAPT